MPESQLHDLNSKSGQNSDPQDKPYKSLKQRPLSTDVSPTKETPAYTIRRRGSRYNIVGPQGRIFAKYKSASIAGPRWEELTGTIWPYKSSAYEPGTRLRQIEWQTVLDRRADETPRPESSGAHQSFQPADTPPEPVAIIPLDYQIVSIRQPQAHIPPALQSRLQDPAIRAVLERESKGSTLDARWARQLLAAMDAPRTTVVYYITCAGRRVAGPYPVLKAVRTVLYNLQAQARLEHMAPDAVPMLPLPACPIDLQAHAHLIRQAASSPQALFDERVQQALRDEVTYHRPHAAWAQSLLGVLDIVDHAILHRALEKEPSLLRNPALFLSEALAPPLPNILDIYHNPVLALHPEQEKVYAMLREEARGSGVLSEFAGKVMRMLRQWRNASDQLRFHLERQSAQAKEGQPLTIDHLLGGPAHYRRWRVLQNRVRNRQRAALIDSQAILNKHLAWQEQQSARVSV